MFLSTLLPALVLALLYIAYYVSRGSFDVRVSPQAPERAAEPLGRILLYALRSLPPPALLIVAVLASIIAGWATPPQSVAVGAMGEILSLIVLRAPPAPA